MSSPTGPRAYSYVRMSTDLQLKGDSLRRQLEASSTYAAANGLDLVDESRLEDIGVSAFKGANVAEGALGRFLDAAKAGKVPAGSFLLVESLDRLSRQEVRKSLGIFLSIIDAGINIVTLADNRVYTAQKTEFVDLVISLVIMSRAHEESQIKSRRVGAAWANKRARARSQPLTATCPAWLRLSPDRIRYEVIDGRAEVVRQIFNESASGIGNYSIARRLNKGRVPHFGRSNGWHPSYVSKILKSRAVIGEFQPHRLVDGERRPDGDAVKGYFPAVVDEQLFYRVQLGLHERLERGAGRKGTRVSNLFSGVLTCAYCRSLVKFENKGQGPKGGTYLVCDGARRGLSCDATRWRYDHFEASFLSFVSEVDLTSILEDGAGRKATLENEILALKGRLGEVQVQCDRSFELMQRTSAIDFVAKKLDELEARRIALEGELRGRESELTAVSIPDSAIFSDIKPLLDRIQARDDETYKLRSAIAARLRSIITTVLIAPLGKAPLSQRAIELARQHGDQAVADHLARIIDHRRYFIAGFKDGSMRAVYPSDDDPARFEEQVTSSTDEGLMRRYPDHEVQVFPPRLVASDFDEPAT